MPEPRRSQRERKTAQPFKASETTDKRAGVSESEHDSDLERTGDENDDIQSEEEGGQDDYHALAPKTATATRKGATKSYENGVKTSAPRKPRAAKSTKQKNASKTPRRKKDAFDPANISKISNISDDSPLFNAVANPNAALQSTVDDYFESLNQDRNSALAELVNFVLRCCGCNDSVDSDQAVDEDGIVDVLDNMTEVLKQHDTAIYPLNSKLPIFKKFRKSLSEFLRRLVTVAAETQILYTSDFMDILKQWIIVMSSSQIRSFRHTATFIALEIQSSLCSVGSAAEKEASVIGRQREGENKRKANNKASSARSKELEDRADKAIKYRDFIRNCLSDFFHGVFVHRYRDLDMLIRADCVRSMGVWFENYPSYFVNGEYLRYVGWVLADKSPQVRLEAVKALLGVYEQQEYISALSHFTERFKGRLIQMAMGDTELNIRVAVVDVLQLLDDHSILEDDDREKLCLLALDKEPKVRKSSAVFVKAIWEEAVEERLASKGKPNSKDRERAGIKALGSVLVRLDKSMEELTKTNSAEDDSVVEGGALGWDKTRSQVRHALAPFRSSQASWAALIVDALWNDLEVLQDWKAFLDILLLDHSAAGEDILQTPSRGRRGKASGKNATGDEVIDEAWKLEEEEEGVLLELFIPILRSVKSSRAAAKKGEEETVTDDITRALIKSLPRLFLKYQTDPDRIMHVLQLPCLMNLDLYLEMRMISSYSNLWDDLIKQFLSHTSKLVLKQCMEAMLSCIDATSLANTNSSKILELEDELSNSLRDAVAGRDEIEMTTFAEDEVVSLTALCGRIEILAGTRDMSGWIEDDEGGKQSSAWEIMSALADRGRLGYEEEEQLVEHSMAILHSFIIWKTKRLRLELVDSERARMQEALRPRRDGFLSTSTDFALGTQGNTTEIVKRAAFQHLLHLNILFGARSEGDAADSLTLRLDDESQYRCAGFIQAEIQRYTDRLHPKMDNHMDDDDESDDDEDDEDERSENGLVHGSSKSLEAEYSFLQLMTVFLRSILTGTIDIQHAAVLLPFYGRLGRPFDAVCKRIIEHIRQSSLIAESKPELLVSTVQKVMEESFTMLTNGIVKDEKTSVQLAKVLATSFTIRGSQLAIVKRLSSKNVADIHVHLLRYLVNRLAALDEKQDERMFKRTAALFKSLIPLLVGIDNNDSLRIKAYMEQAFAESGLAISAAKAWDAQRAYEKRITSKDKAGQKVKKRKARKDDAMITSDDGGGTGESSGEEGVQPRVSKSRPRSTQQKTELEEASEEETSGPSRPRPRPKAAYGRKSKSDPVSDFKDPPSSQKRKRDDDDESAVDEAVGNEDDDAASEDIVPVITKRRRIRH